ncbi:MAG: FKBP-type peptidyl-prolyl cis-trans isomerase [Thermodesulfobacteriota bacterium]
MQGGVTFYEIEPAQSYVRISYTVKIADGPVLKGAGEPAEMDFVTGFRQVVPGLERRLVGKAAGMRLAFTVPAEEAFGTRNEELVIEKRAADFHFPPHIKPYPGMEIPLVAPGTAVPETVAIKEVRAESIVIDLNHPLAGAALEYDLHIVEARPASEQDICSEWQEAPCSESCGDSCGGRPHEIVLGVDDGSRDR